MFARACSLGSPLCYERGCVLVVHRTVDPALGRDLQRSSGPILRFSQAETDAG